MTDGSPLPRKTRRWLRWVVMVTGILCAAVWLFFRDEELKPVDDLMPQGADIAWDDNNGWKRLEDLAKELPALDHEDEKRIYKLISSEQASIPAGVKKFTLPVAQLSALETVAAAPLFQAEQIDDPYFPARASAGPEPTPGLAALYDLRYRFYITVLSATEENDVLLVLRLLKLSSALQKRITAGATSTFTHGLGALWINDALVAHSLVRLDWNDLQLKELAGCLADDPVTLEDTREAVYHEFRTKYLFLLNSPGAPDVPPLLRIDVPRFLYQKHRTANQYANQMRVLRDSLFVSTHEEIRQQQNECLTSSPAWLDPNRYGTVFLSGTSLVLLGSPYKRPLASRRSIRVIAALHRCLKARGSLPAGLDELVPEFLPAVPEDPFRFLPLHWDAAHRAVQNGGDDGAIPPVSPTQTRLISDDHRTFLFRTRADEAAWLNRLAPPVPKKPLRPDKPIPTH